MAEHEHGSMNIEEQEKTFEGFVNIVKWSVILIILTLIFLYLVNG